MASIEDALRTLAFRTSQELLHALAGASIEEVALLNQSGKRRSVAPAPRPELARSPNRVVPRVAKKPTSPKVPTQSRRSAKQLSALAGKVADYVRAHAAEHPDGIGIAQIAKGLREDLAGLGYPVRLALEEGTLKKTGAKNFTRYFPGSPSSQG